jgi:DNA mismatch endonuclease (patch repair protein)
VNGCFWHGHEGCKYYTVPKSNTEFWVKKISRNRERDAEVHRKIAALGWHCIVLWECQLKPKVREQTLTSLEYTLNHIFLQDRIVKRYDAQEEEEKQSIAAEEDNL